VTPRAGIVAGTIEIIGKDNMSHMTRRRMLLGAAAAGAAATIGPLSASRPGRAAAPAAGKQAPGVYRLKLGEFEVTQISDGGVTFPLADGFVTNADRAKVNAALEAAYMPKDTVNIIFNPMVINTGSKLVLIDTGYGSVGPKTAGQLPVNLAAAGIDPKAIDVVIISHFHPDHMNGLIGADGALAFPNAEIMVPEPEAAFWTSDDNMGKAKGGVADNFKNVRRVMAPLAGKVTKYGWDKEVAPGITAVSTAGHTPGHTSFVIASGSARLLVQSDVTNHPALFLRNPDWHVMFDMDGDKADATRHKFYDMAAAEKTLVAGFHFPFPSLGHVEKDGAGYRLVPIAWSPTI